MGNCFRRGSSSSIVWAGDEWDSLTTEKDAIDELPFNKERILSHLKSSSSSSSKSSGTSTTTEVKIKITKKELEELLGKAEGQNLSAEQVFARLVNARSSRYTVHHHHHWRPELMSIPEAN